jgi:transposase
VLLKLTGVEQRFNAVVKLLRNGLTVTEVTERYGVSRQAVHGGLPGPCRGLASPACARGPRGTAALTATGITVIHNG